ncbi:MAG TPA: hypothetical protein VGF04_10505 [Solirubrobacterales bacterium]
MRLEIEVAIDDVLHPPSSRQRREPGTKPPASTAKSTTVRSPALSSAGSTRIAFSPVRGF